MFKSLLLFKKNILFQRIYSIRYAVLTYSFASFLDIFTIIIISSIFNQISEKNFDGNFYIYIITTLLLIIIRTFSVISLRRFSFKSIFKEKLKNEKFIVSNFISYRVKNAIDDEDLNLFKEKLINSSNIAAVNFDIPVVSIISELIFAVGGILVLFKIFGLNLFLFNLPVFIGLILFSKFVSFKLKILGKRILKFTEKRLNSIDNISELAIELSALKDSENLVEYFKKINSPYNNVLSKQIITSNMMQIYTESASFLIILLSLIFLIINISETSLANSATSLAVLSRMVPAFTRSISFVTQLQFGVPSVARLSQMNK